MKTLNLLCLLTLNLFVAHPTLACSDESQHQNHSQSFHPSEDGSSLNHTVIAGCKPGDFVWAEGPNAIIPFGTNRGYGENRCLKIRVGTSVTIAASGFHPLDAMAPIDGVINPFDDELLGGAQYHPVTQKLTQPGLYGYFCRLHSDALGNGMAGAIWVIE